MNETELQSIVDAMVEHFSAGTLLEKVAKSSLESSLEVRGYSSREARSVLNSLEFVPELLDRLGSSFANMPTEENPLADPAERMHDGIDEGFFPKIFFPEIFFRNSKFF